MKEFPLGTMNRNIRDVFAHLYHWQLMMKTGTKLVSGGSKADIPSKGYTWKTVPKLNLLLYRYGRITPKVPLHEIKVLLTNSHKEMMKMIDDHSNEELFVKGICSWTGTLPHLVLILLVPSSHYDWALN
ncbi:MAG: ClbS/DfsB family four-helix bundle protein [Saprospiraceae bacterium]|nr:ClbS/DfsB family four-helix bundle protein [Saprospiraceae bacterium]